VYSVNFTNWGEPLLNKHLPDMIEYCKNVKHIPFVKFDTNFNVPLLKEFIDRLLSSGLDMLSVSMDGATQETMRSIEGVGILREWLVI